MLLLVFEIEDCKFEGGIMEFELLVLIEEDTDIEVEFM